MITFIHGPDRLLALERARELARKCDPGGENTSWFDGKETSLDRLVAAIGTISFFGGARVVVVSDFLAKAGREKSAEAGDESEDRPARTNPALETLAAAVPEAHCLILLEPSLTGPPAALKAAAPHAAIVAGEPPRGTALLSWISEAATRAGAGIDRRTAQLLAETLYPQTWDRKPANPRYDRPPDLALLSQEIEKLALSVLPGQITAREIAALVPGGPDQRVFRFLDAALAGDLGAATLELDRLDSAGEEPAMLLAQVLGQMELTTIAQAAAGRDAASVARDLGSISAPRMSAIMQGLRRQPHGQPAAPIGAEVDRRLKTGRIRRPDDALREVVTQLSVGAAQKTGRSG